MKPYKILFISEEKENFNYFLDFIEEEILSKKMEVITVLPLPTLEKMIEYINNINPDAVVTEYMLNDIKIDVNYNVPYDGNSLRINFLSIREFFPFLILDDFNYLVEEEIKFRYMNNILHSNKKDVKLNFITEVLETIDSYKTEMDMHKKYFQFLMEKKEKRVTEKELENIIYLKSLLERHKIILGNTN